jgi:hypothetical protein
MYIIKELEFYFFVRGLINYMCWIIRVPQFIRAPQLHPTSSPDNRECTVIRK